MAPTHPRRQLRLRQRDYSLPGCYFVTICTVNRADLLGRVVGREMRLNPFGEVVGSTWRWIGQHFAGVELDECAIMPDHLHGIVVLTPSVAPLETNGAAGAETAQRKPLGRIVGAFKTRSTSEVNRLRQSPGARLWQRGFWDRVIRNAEELARTRAYIRRNPETYGPRTFHL